MLFTSLVNQPRWSAIVFCTALNASQQQLFAQAANAEPQLRRQRLTRVFETLEQQLKRPPTQCNLYGQSDIWLARQLALLGTAEADRAVHLARQPDWPSEYARFIRHKTANTDACGIVLQGELGTSIQRR